MKEKKIFKRDVFVITEVTDDPYDENKVPAISGGFICEGKYKFIPETLVAMCFVILDSFLNLMSEDKQIKFEKEFKEIFLKRFDDRQKSAVDLHEIKGGRVNYYYKDK